MTGGNASCLVLLLSLLALGDAFVVQPLNHHHAHAALSCSTSTTTTTLLHANANANADNDVDIEAASGKLLWEVLEERQAQPVLNLSKRDDAPSPDSNNEIVVDTSEWDQGQRWSETKKGLQALDIISSPLLLQKCPQLYRLESSQVIQTAAWLIEKGGFDATFIISEPRVLSYKCCDVEYGLEFLQQMLMSTSFGPAFLGPLLLSGIDGGLQERAVQEALGAAGDATYNANQRIAGDAAATLKSLQQKRQGL
jgi:hypothetical protein